MDDNDSPKFTMGRYDWAKWIGNAKLFLAPVLIIYLTSVIGTISVDGHVFAPRDLMPSTFTQGGITLYVLNSILDWVRKWSTGY